MRYDPRDYGALGEGWPRTVQSAWLNTGRYANIEAARAASGIADLQPTHLADGAAWQAAINAAVKAGGGVVGSRPGRFRCDDRTLYLPYRTIHPNDSQPTVSIQSDGPLATRLEWQDNSAVLPATAGIAYRKAAHIGDYVAWRPSASSYGQMSRSSISGVCLRGPGDFTGSWPVGTSYPTFDGIEMPDRVSMADCHLSGWRRGLRMQGGQRLLDRVYIQDCYDAIYLDERHPDHHGDMTLVRCWLSGKRACIAIHHTAAFFGNIIGSFTGGAPFFMLKEAGNGIQSYGGTSPHANILCAGCVFEGGQWEAIGNGLFVDLNLPRKLRMFDVSIINQTYIYNHQFDLWTDSVNFPRAALFDLGDMSRVRIISVSDPGRWGPKEEALIKVRSVHDCEIRGVDGMLTSAANMGKPLLHKNAGIYARGLALYGDGWSGRCWPVESSSGAAVPVERGHVLSLRYSAAHRMAGSGHRIGVAMSSAMAGEVVAVAERGGAMVRTDGKLAGLGVLVAPNHAEPGTVKQAGAADVAIGGVTHVDNAQKLAAVELR